MAEQYNEVTNRLVSTRNADNPAVNHIVTGSDAVYDDNYPLLVNGYIECDTTPISGPTGNPHEQGWCEEEVVEGEGTGKYILTEDATIELDKSYYKPIGARQAAINNQLRTTISDLSGIALHASEYNEATVHEDDNPQANGWYELSGTTYVLTTDTTVESGKTYYIRVTKITSNEDKIIAKDDGYVPTAGAVGRALGVNFEDNLQSTSRVKGLTANMGRVLNENKADINGYYETMSVGSAKNLDGETINSEAYLIRPTGGENNEVVSGLASVVGMEGNSVVWNQLVQNGDFESSSGWQCANGTFSVTNNVCTASWNSPYGAQGLYRPVSYTVSHKYFVRATVLNTQQESRTYWIGQPEAYVSSSFTANEKKELSGIITVTTISGNNARVYLGGAKNIDNSVEVTNIMIIDLTILRIDNLTTTDQVEAWLAQHPGLKPHYAYNSGTILSANTLGFKTYSRNLLNPSNGLAKLIPYTHTTNSNKYTVKGIPTGATVTYTPDNTGVAVDVTSAITDNTFDISSYGIGTLYIPDATANTYVCMKYDGAMDDEVVSYKENTYNFDVRKVYGKVGGEGEWVQCFPDGMKKVGNVYDTLTADKAVKKTGYVTNLDQISWNVDDNYPTTRFTNVSFGLISGQTDAIINRSYIFTNKDWFRLEDKEVRVYYGGDITIAIRDDSYSTINSFKMSLQGAAICARITPQITYTDLIYRDGGIDRPLADVLFNINVDNWSIEEQLLTPYENGNPTSIPATIKTQYGMDAVEAIDTLQKTCYFADDIKANLQALLNCINTNCAATLGGTFSISDTATDKMFDFTFTPTESTNSTEEPTETI